MKLFPLKIYDLILSQTVNQDVKGAVWSLIYVSVIAHLKYVSGYCSRLKMCKVGTLSTVKLNENCVCRKNGICSLSFLRCLQLTGNDDN